MRLPVPLTALPGLLFLALGAVLILTSGQNLQIAGNGYVDRPLPEFDRPALRAGDIGLASEDIGRQVALIHVFASWCSTCRAEHPKLMQIAETAPVPIYGLNWRDRTGAALLYLDRFGDPYRATGVDAQGALGSQLGVTGVPETLVVDATGRIRYRHVGPISDRVWQTVLLPLVHELESSS